VEVSDAQADQDDEVWVRKDVSGAEPGNPALFAMTEGLIDVYVLRRPLRDGAPTLVYRAPPIDVDADRR
jgi:hypothetical protein